LSEFRYRPPDYSRLRVIQAEWEPDYRLSVTVDDGEVRIRANRDGLVSLAKHLLTLAQDGVPSGSHVHYDPGGSLEDDSTPLVVERAEF
jgi:hypothetical protein